eukprot:TRINITY_DN5345_c0_g1_i7.p1 TRINITY_DN5345_c0_g1~~TRINITY_DN5345_c0_g1_i7.p1  ORF type:complete len:826 (+),score=261.68 TRINITY_DN5345_c0_g1_i7:174-2651(+)
MVGYQPAGDARKRKAIQLATVRVEMRKTSSSLTLQMPETQSVYALKKKLLLLTHDDLAVTPEELEVVVLHNHAEFVLEDDHIIRDIPYADDGCCAVSVHARRPVKRVALQSSRATAQVPPSERVARVTAEFETKFRSAVQFRLDDFLWEEEAQQTQRKDMQVRLKEEIDEVTDRHIQLLESVEETVGLRKALVAQKLRDRREEALNAAEKKMLLQDRRQQAAEAGEDDKSLLDIEREKVSRRLRGQTQFRMYVFGGIKYLIWTLLFTLFVFYFREDGYMTSELYRNQLLGMGSLATAQEISATPDVNKIPQLFWTITSMDKMWRWVNDTMLTAAFANRMAANSTFTDSGSSSNRTVYQWSSKVIGCIRMRQLRTVDDKCRMLDSINGYIPRCYLPYSEDAESKRAFGENGQYTWRSAADLNGKLDLYSGQDGTEYPGGGFVVDLPMSLAGSQEMVRLMEESRWVDQATRVVFVDMNLYQPYPSRVIMQRMAIEFDVSGRVTPSQSTLFRQPYVYTDSSDYGVLIFESVLSGFFVFHVATESVQLVRGGWAYFKTDPWNMVEWIHMLAFAMVAGFHVAGALELESLDISSSSSDFVNTRNVVFWMRLEAALLVINCLATYFKGYKYLELIASFAQLGDVLVVSWGTQVFFMASILIVIMGYAMAMNLVFGTYLGIYSSLPNSILSLFESIIGQSRPWDGVLLKNMPFSLQIAGWLYFTTFCILMVLIVTTLFSAVIAHSYQILQEEGGGRSTFNTDLKEFRSSILSKINEMLDKIRSASKTTHKDEEEEEEEEQEVEEVIDDTTITQALVQLELIKDAFGDPELAR